MNVRRATTQEAKLLFNIAFKTSNQEETIALFVQETAEQPH
jgi:hypothetical protein